jgi:hypothetical protein
LASGTTLRRRQQSMPARHNERLARAAAEPIVGSLPNHPGILAAMMLSSELAVPLRALADALLIRPFQDSTISRGERELIATAVSAANNCFCCKGTHGAFAW